MSNTSATDPVIESYERGRRVGLGTAALALAVTAYVNLLGIEKSLLAIVLAFVALKGSRLTAKARTSTRIAIGLASVHAITVVAIVAIYSDKLTALARELIALYHSLS